MFLALQLGGMTADELAKRINSRELMEWIAYFKLESESPIASELKAEALNKLVRRGSSRKPYSQSHR